MATKDRQSKPEEIDDLGPIIEESTNKESQAVKNAKARDIMEKQKIDKECGVFEDEEAYFENLLKDDDLT